MRECWLKPNRRVLAVASGFMVALALILSLLAGGWGGSNPVVRWLLAGASAWAWVRVVLLVLHACRPRLAYGQGQLQVFLRQLKPLTVPVAQVECFFLGQADSMITAAAGNETQDPGAKTRTIVVRLAEAATDWKTRPVREDLGRWADGYITIRGTWCEPITPELVKSLNSRLVKIHRQQRQERVKS